MGKRREKDNRERNIGGNTEFGQERWTIITTLMREKREVTKQGHVNTD